MVHLTLTFIFRLISLHAQMAEKLKAAIQGFAASHAPTTAAADAS